MTRYFLAATLVFLLTGGGQAADAGKKPAKENPSFGVLRAPAQEEARNQAEAWLKGVGKTDATTMKAFEEIWKSDQRLLDKVVATFGLGDATAAKLLAEAKDADANPALRRDDGDGARWADPAHEHCVVAARHREQASVFGGAQASPLVAVGGDLTSEPVAPPPSRIAGWQVAPKQGPPAA